MIESITIGIGEAWNKKRVITLVYLLQLLFGLFLGMQVYNIISPTVGKSLGLQKLLQGFDYQVVMDFMNQHGMTLSGLIGQLQWIALIYLLIGTFMSAGIWHCIVHCENSLREFWNGGGVLFGRFLWVNIFYLFLFLLITGLIWIPLLTGFISMVEKFGNEKIVIYIIILALVVYIILLLTLFVMQSITKRNLVYGNLSSWQSIKKSFGAFRSHYWSLLSLVVCFLIIQLLVGSLYLLLDSSVGMISSTLILIFIFIHQFIAFFRIYWRVALYSAINSRMKKNKVIVATQL